MIDAKLLINSVVFSLSPIKPIIILTPKPIAKEIIVNTIASLYLPFKLSLAFFLI